MIPRFHRKHKRNIYIYRTHIVIVNIKPTKSCYNNAKVKAITRENLPALLREAAIKPRLTRELRFVPEEITDWEARDFIAVMNKSNTEGVLIAEFDHLRIVPFRLRGRTANSMGRVEAIICDICATWQRGSHSAIISFTKQKGSTSFLCCGDLLCSLHVRDKTAAAKLSRTQLRETISVPGRIERLQARLHGMVS